MSTMRSEIYKAFRSVGADEPTALKAAEAFNSRDHSLTSIETDVAAMKPSIAKLETTVAKLVMDMGIMKWMMGFMLACQAGIFLKLFVH